MGSWPQPQALSSPHPIGLICFGPVSHYFAQHREHHHGATTKAIANPKNRTLSQRNKIADLHGPNTAQLSWAIEKIDNAPTATCLGVTFVGGCNLGTGVLPSHWENVHSCCLLLRSESEWQTLK
jgi:hypothetical protein